MAKPCHSVSKWRKQMANKNINATVRLVISALVAFCFYFAWSYWANSGPEIKPTDTFRSALVQGLYSGFVTLGFTFILERAVARFNGHCLSLAFMTPILCSVYSKSKQNLAIKQAFNHGLNRSAQFLEGARIPGAVLAPLLPLLVQSALVILVNLINQTPNLWLTVAPSIFFTGLYGYVYTFTLLKHAKISVNK